MQRRWEKERAGGCRGPVLRGDGGGGATLSMFNSMH